MKIEQQTTDSTVNLALDTLKIEKQALIFCGSKRGAEKQAEDIAKKLKQTSETLTKLAEKIQKTLPVPTQQCERLALCIKKGIAFHHAGLHAKQRELIEDSFKEGIIKIICSTPTLAAGLDMPAFRAIIRDTKRYGGRFGMTYIPVLEFQQMIGRAGRPKYDDFGEGIAVAKNERDKEELYNRYILGDIEEIYSKLAVEPVLRTYLLSLIATNFVSTREEILNFFEKTFWAHQYKDMEELEEKITKMLDLLVEWEFLKTNQSNDFVSAEEMNNEKFKATQLGERIAELYIDPLTAFNFIQALKKGGKMKIVKEVSFLHLIARAPGMQPLFRVRSKEYDDIQEKILHFHPYLLENEPSLYEPEHEDFLDAIKTALVLQEWMEERDDAYLMETYGARPGELRAKLTIGDWLLYTLAELSRLIGEKELIKHINKTRFRLKHGVKEELLPLLRFEGIGRIRARKLFNNKIKDVRGVKQASIATLSHLLGKKLAQNMKKQVGEKDI